MMRRGMRGAQGPARRTHDIDNKTCRRLHSHSNGKHDEDYEDDTHNRNERGARIAPPATSASARLTQHATRSTPPIASARGTLHAPHHVCCSFLTSPPLTQFRI